MTDPLYAAAAAWMTGLLVLTLLKVLTARTTASRILGLDMLILIILGLLVLVSGARGVPHLMDAVLALALISFLATVALSRFYGRGRVMR